MIETNLPTLTILLKMLPILLTSLVANPSTLAIEKHVDIKQFGAKGDARTDDSLAIEKAVYSLGSLGGEIVLSPGRYRIASNLILPPTISLSFFPGATLLLAPGVVTTLRGPIQAGLHPIFEGNGKVTFTGNSRISATYPHWWGATGDGVNDDQPAFQRAVNAISSLRSFASENTGLVLQVPMGTYRFKAPLKVPYNSGIGLVGAGKTRSNLFLDSPSSTLLEYSGNNIRGNIKGLRLTGRVGSLSGIAVAVNGQGNQLYIEDCWINNFKYGIVNNPSSDSNYFNNVFEFVATPILCRSSSDILISHNMFYNCGPISQGDSEKEPTFHLIASKRISLTNNRMVTDAPTSPQYGGILKIDGCDSITFNQNVENTQTTQAGTNILIADSNRITINQNVFGRHLGPTIRLARANTDIQVNNNQFAGSKSGALPTVHLSGSFRRVTLTGNLFSPGASAYDLVADTGNQLIVTGNVFSMGAFIDPGVSRCVFGPNVNGSRMTYLSSRPIYGTWQRGDYVPNTTPAEKGPKGKKYIIQGWRCLEGGTPGKWVEVRALTGN